MNPVWRPWLNRSWMLFLNINVIYINNYFKTLQFLKLFWPFYYRCHFSLIISFEFQNIFHIFTIFGLETYIQYNSNFDYVHFLVLEVSLSFFFKIGKRNLILSKCTENPAFCLLLEFWLVGFFIFLCYLDFFSNQTYSCGNGCKWSLQGPKFRVC